MSAFSEFHYSGSGGPVSGRALAAFATNVASASVNVWLQRFEGYVLACDAVEVANTPTGVTVRVSGLIAVLGGRVIMEPLLECPLRSGETDVFLTASVTPVPLDAEVPAGLQARVVRGELTTDPAGAPAICVAKCDWARPEGKDAARNEATPDRGWWPPVVRVADHPFSREVAEELGELLGDSCAATMFLFALAVRGDEVAWPALLHAAFAVAAERFRDRPDRLAELRKLAREPRQAAVASGLLRLLRGDQAANLPTSITIDGKRARLAAVLHDARPSQHFDSSGAVVKLDCGTATQSGWLAVAVSATTNAFYRVEASVDGIPHDAIRQAGRGAEAVVWVEVGSRVQVAVSSDTASPTRIGVGLYQLDHTRG